MTWPHVRLLGPCFKTGRRGRQPTHDRDADRVKHEHMLYMPAQIPVDFKAKNTGLEHKERTSPMPSVWCQRFVVWSTGEVQPPITLTVMQRSCDTPTPLLRYRQPEPPVQTSRNPSVYHYTVSRTIELSLQSSFQLSYTVLVYYRSRGHI